MYRVLLPCLAATAIVLAATPTFAVPHSGPIGLRGSIAAAFVPASIPAPPADRVAEGPGSARAGLDIALAGPPPRARRSPDHPTPATRVAFHGDHAVGTIVVDNSRRALFFVDRPGEALRYPIAVGRPDAQWEGEFQVSRMAHWPSWRPTPNMRRRNPGLPRFMAGGPRNPLGARAIYIGDTYWRIHGTTAPQSIGTASSNGCLRMHNEHVIDLFERVRVGDRVVTVDSLDARIVGEPLAQRVAAR